LFPAIVVSDEFADGYTKLFDEGQVSDETLEIDV